VNFFGDNLHFLGHVIDAKRLHMNQSKVQAIEKADQVILCNLCSELLWTIHSQFTENFGTSIINYWKNTIFQWDRNYEESFRKVKFILKSDVILAHYLTIPVKLATDVSQHGIGVVLLHIYPDGAERPSVCFKSFIQSRKRTFCDSQRSISHLLGREEIQSISRGTTFHSNVGSQTTALFGENKGISVMVDFNNGLYSSDFNYEM